MASNLWILRQGWAFLWINCSVGDFPQRKAEGESGLLVSIYVFSLKWTQSLCCAHPRNQRWWIKAVSSCALSAPSAEAGVWEWALRSEPSLEVGPVAAASHTFCLHNLKQLSFRPCSQGNSITSQISSPPRSDPPHGFPSHSELEPVSFLCPSRPSVICRTSGSPTDSVSDILFLLHPTPAMLCTPVGAPWTHSCASVWTWKTFLPNSLPAPSLPFFKSLLKGHLPTGELA